MEIITIEVRTQAQAKIILSKLQELDNQNIAMNIKRQTKTVKNSGKRLKAIENGLKEVKEMREEKKKPPTMQQLLKEIKNGE